MTRPKAETWSQSFQYLVEDFQQAVLELRLDHPRGFFAVLGALAAALLALACGTPFQFLLFAAVAGYIANASGLRLGSLLVLGVALAPKIARQQFNAEVVRAMVANPFWIFSMALVVACSFRAVLNTSGLVKKRGVLRALRPWRASQPGFEGWRVWALESFGTALLVTFIHCSLLMVFGFLAWTLSSAPTDSMRNSATAVFLLGFLLFAWALSTLAYKLLTMRRAEPVEARLTMIADLHRELRSDLLFLAHFKAKKRW